MTVRYHIRHTTDYTYTNNVSDSHHLARLTPLEADRQKLHNSEIKITPAPDVYSSYTDYFGNLTTFFSLTIPHKKLTIESNAEIEVWDRASNALDLSPPWEEVRERVANPLHAVDRAASEFLYTSPLCPVDRRLADYALESFPKGTPIIEAAQSLTKRIYHDFNFDRSATTVSTPVIDTFEKRAGVCQDFAHLQISCLRSIGLPARYVSGYLRTEPPPGKPRLIGADASHAWVSVYIPQHGWMEFDATNNVLPNYNHIRVAYGRDYNDICPIRGTVYGGGSQQLDIGVTVTPMHEETSIPTA